MKAGAKAGLHSGVNAGVKTCVTRGVSIDRLSGVGASAGVCLLPWG